MLKLKEKKGSQTRHLVADTRRWVNVLHTAVWPEILQGISPPIRESDFWDSPQQVSASDTQQCLSTAVDTRDATSVSCNRGLARPEWTQRSTSGN